MDVQNTLQNRQIVLALDRLITCADLLFLQRFIIDAITQPSYDYNDREKADINALFGVINELSRHETPPRNVA